MRFEFKSSFERSTKALNPADKKEIKEVAAYLIDILSQDRPLHQGVGLKRLRGAYWEIRKGIKTRILLRWEGDLVEFVLAGNHDDIRKFLKSL
jgi:hypothetical protein